MSKKPSPPSGSLRKWRKYNLNSDPSPSRRHQTPLLAAHPTQNPTAHPSSICFLPRFRLSASQSWSTFPLGNPVLRVRLFVLMGTWDFAEGQRGMDAVHDGEAEGI